MSLHFKYKEKNQSIFKYGRVPGRVTPGINGLNGDDGLNGSQIYFCKYDLSDDYTKELVIDRIKMNMTLEIKKSTILEGIKYVNGDIIITTDLKVYKLTISEADEYDLVLLGQINKLKDETSKEKLLNNIMFTEFVVTKAWNHSVQGDALKGTFNIPVVSNRSMDASGNTIICKNPLKSSYHPTTTSDSSVDCLYENADKRTYGFSFIPIIHISDSSVSEKYDFYMKIHIPIEKSPQVNAFTMYNNAVINIFDKNSTDPTSLDKQKAFKFFKHAEIKLVAQGPNDNPSYSLLSDSSSYNMSDMVCDKLHPSGNNISSWYNMPSTEKFLNIDNENVLICGLRLQKDGTPYIITYNKNSMNQHQCDSSVEYLYKNDSIYFTDFLYDYNVSQVQYSKYSDIFDDASINMINFRGGDSAYFSSKTIPTFKVTDFPKLELEPGIYANNIYVMNSDVSNMSWLYDNYVHNIRCTNRNIPSIGTNYNDSIAYKRRRISSLSKYMSKTIMDFIINKQNIYELICVDKSTGETFTINSRMPEVNYKYDIEGNTNQSELINEYSM